MFLLVDSRHPGLPLDVQAHRWLIQTIAPPRILATKVDKLSQSERARNLRELERVFGETPLAVSATSGEGLEDLWRVVAAVSRSVQP
jgi:GTP-binding protein